MNVLVAGGAGFIGHHLISLLIQIGVQEIRVLDTRPLDPIFGSRVSYWQGDFAQTINQYPEVLAGVDIVFHLAWTSIPESSTKDPLADLNANVPSTLQLLQHCVTHRIKRVVFASTGGAIYGIPKSVPISEDHPTNPISAYGITKLAVEKYLALFHWLYGLEYVIIRPSVPYGEYQNLFGRQGVVAVFFGKILRQEPLEIWGDPHHIVRDFFHVSDLARACWLAATAGEPASLYNIGGGTGISLAQLIDAMRLTVNATYEIRTEIMPARQFDVPALVLDTSRAAEQLNWKPEIDLMTGLYQVWNWIQNQPFAQNPALSPGDSAL